MNVEVAIEVSMPPEEKDLDRLRKAASSLTNNPSSITVNATRGRSLILKSQDERILLITRFTIKTTAQYKVVDDIWKEFEFWTFDLKGYEDMSISFPKSAQKQEN